jgi:hypothetical protein
MSQYLTSHFGDSHGSMLGNGVAPFARKASKRVGRGNIDDSAASNVTCTVSAGPGSWVLFSHCCCLGTHAQKVAPRVNVHNAVKVFDISVR